MDRKRVGPQHKFSDLRRQPVRNPDEVKKLAHNAFFHISETQDGKAIREFLSRIVVDVDGSLAPDDLLETAIRRKVASEFLSMMDAPYAEKTPTSNNAKS